MSPIFPSRPTAIAAALLLTSASAAYAFQPLITDDTGTQGTGGNQLEASYTRDRTSGTSDETKTLDFVFTRGLTDTLDLFIHANRVSVTSGGASNSGAGNPSFGAKWRFYEAGEENRKLSFAVKPEVLLPVSAAKEAAGLGNGKTSYGASFIATQEVSFGAVHANVFIGHDAYKDHNLFTDAKTSRISVAPVWDLNENWKLGLDIGTETVKPAGATNRADFIEIGAVYSPNKDLDFALGFIRRNDATSPTPIRLNTLTFGVTWRF